MDLDTYTFENSGNDPFSYYFVSQGNNGDIFKIVQFTLTEEEKIYNLSLGDYRPDLDFINYDSISNNGDINVVLSTVGGIVLDFITKFPDASIFAIGSTSIRTRLYRYGLTKYKSEIEKNFLLYGRKNEEWETFEKGENYESFLLKKI